jgi:hypothetical protein
MMNVMKPWAADNDRPNPWAMVDNALAPTDAKEAHPTWPQVVVDTFIEQAALRGQPGVGRAVALARYSGARRGDLIWMTQAVRKATEDGPILDWLSTKYSVQVTIDEDVRLTDWLDRLPNMQPLSNWQRWSDRQKGQARVAPATIVYTQENLPYMTEEGLGHAVRALVLELFADDLIDADHYTLHGLRHTFGVELALAGATEQEGMSAMGHRGPETFRKYVRQASRIQMARAGMKKVRDKRDGQTPAPMAAGVNENAPQGEVQNKVQKTAKQA